MACPAYPPEAVLDAVPQGLLVFDANRELVFANAAARQAMEKAARSADPAMSDLRAIFRLCDPQTDRPLAESQNPLTRALRGESVPETEYVVRRGEAGPKQWVECAASPLRDSNGAVTGAVFTFRDIRERKKREYESEAGAQLRDFVYHENLAGIIHSTVDGRIIDCNDAILRMWGYTNKRELLGQRAHQVYCDPSDRDRLLAILSSTGRLSEYEVCFRRQDGSRCWALLNVRLLDPAAGTVGGSIISTVIDITERKRSEETLRKSEQRFTSFMRHLPGVAFIKDVQGRYVYYNEASFDQFGWQPGEIIGKTDLEIWPEQYAAAYRDNDENVIQNRRHYEFLETVPHGDSEHSWLIYKFPIVENGKVTMVGGVGVDITERLILEHQLNQARKMDALGLLAGGVAHDFNNLLTVISGYGQLAVEALGDRPDARLAEYLTRVLDSARRASGITGQLLAFSRREAVKPTIIDVADVIAGMEKLLRTMVGEHVNLSIRLGQEPCLVLSDEHQLQQVVINLAVNARDAMPLGGDLEIRCRRLPDPVVSERGGQLGILLQVQDTGIGMDEATKARIFDPFFTSKEVGKGTGLGLSTVYGIVSQAEGTIEVESEPGVGTTFRLYFPEAAGEKKKQASRAEAKTGGQERVLLVEDDENVRNLTTAILKQQGYEVLEADSGKAALGLWEKERGRIDVLLSDVVMPNMTGGELAAALRERSPRLKILFMSGYAGDMLTRVTVPGEEIHLLPKPFTPAALGKKLRDVLDA